MANNQQIKVGITFQADTVQAKQQIKNLQDTLSSITKQSIVIENSGIVSAIQSAKQLETALEKATNIDTGKIDFRVFNNTLKAMNTDLATTSANLLNLGPKGQKAFLQLGNAISQAEVPAKRLNNTLMAFGDTLLRTIRWQVASSMIHGFMSTVSQAVGYIENLDKSLNSIKIVTNMNSNAMQDFADKANQLATNLKSTTKEYADASLIFFQQGLDTAEVIDRTNATIKLAKVTGESVKNIASELTAIWNNFDDGTTSLEYFADVITALGAATAASSSEIATGLQKFAAVADTVGLSYEKATAALATVVAETRQSADTVGTAFKTMFARIEGLKLGETLDDGTTLNQYSQALQKVGVNILNQKGELKDMDVILDSIGKKWEKLDRASQVALAQQVAGIRQYSQFMALMDNYGDVLKNQSLAENASGTLDKQFDIYAQSVEAVNKEFEKAKQDLFSELLSVDTVKDFRKIMIDIVKVVKDLIENFGGIKAVIGAIGAVLLTNLLPKLNQSIGNIFTKLQDGFGITNKRMQNSILSMARQAEDFSNYMNSSKTASESDKWQANFNKEALKNKVEQLKIEGSLTESQKMRIEAQRSLLEKMQQETLELQQQAEIEAQSAQVGLQRISNANNTKEVKTKNFENKQINEVLGDVSTEGIEQTQQVINKLEEELKLEQEVQKAIEDGGEKVKQINQSKINGLNEEIEKQEILLEQLKEKQQLGQSGSQNVEKAASLLGYSKEDLNKGKEYYDKQSDISAIELTLEKNPNMNDKRKKELEAELEELKKQTGELEKQLQITEALKELSYGNIGENTQQALKQKAQQNNEDVEHSTSVTDENGQLVTLDSEIYMESGSTAAELFQQSFKENIGEEGIDVPIKINQKHFEAMAKTAGKLRSESKILNNLENGITKALEKQNTAKDKNLKKEKQNSQIRKQGQKELKSQNDEFNRLIKSNNQFGRKLSQITKEMNILDKETGEVDFSKLDQKQMETLVAKIKELQNQAKLAADSASQLREEIGDELTSAGRNAGQDMDELGEKLENSAEKSNTAQHGLERIGQTSQQTGITLKEAFTGAMNSYTQIAQGASQAAMGAQMVHTGFTGLKDAIAEGAGPLEIFTNGTMILNGVMSTSQGIITAVTGAKKLLDIMRQRSLPNIAREGTAVLGEAGAETAGAVATTFHQGAKMGLWGVVAAGILVAGIIAVTASVLKNAAAEQKAAKMAEEDAKAQQENAKATSDAQKKIVEQTKAIYDNNKAWNEAFKTYKDTGEITDELNETALKLCETLDIENGFLFIQQHNYEALAGAIDEAIKKKNKYNKTQSAKNTIAAKASMTSFMQDKSGGIAAGNWSNVAGESFIEIRVNTPADGKDYFAEYTDTQDWKNFEALGWYYDESSGYIQLDQRNLVWGGNEIPNIRASYYAWLKENYPTVNMSDLTFEKSYKQAQENEEFDMLSSTVEAASGELDANFYSAKAESDIDTSANFSEYKKRREEILRQVFKDSGLNYDTDLNTLRGKQLLERTEKLLLQDEGTREYESTFKALEERNKKATDKSYLLNEEVIEDLKKKGLTEDQIYSLYINLDFLPTNKEDLEQILLDNQEFLNDNQLYLTVTANKDQLLAGLKSYNEGKITWEDFKKQYGSDIFDEDFGIGISEEMFRSLTPDERNSIINTWLKDFDREGLAKKRAQEAQDIADITSENEKTIAEEYTNEYIANHKDEVEQQNAELESENIQLKRSIENASSGFGEDKSDMGGNASGFIFLSTDQGGNRSQEAANWNLELARKMLKEGLNWTRDQGYGDSENENYNVYKFLYDHGYFDDSIDGLDTFNNNFWYIEEIGNKIAENTEKMVSDDELRDQAEAYGQAQADSDVNSAQTIATSSKEEIKEAKYYNRNERITDLGLKDGEFVNYLSMLKEIIPYQESVYGNLENYNNAIVEIAIANKRMEKGVKSLVSNWDKWNEIMTDSSATAEDLSNILPEVNEAVKDILNINSSQYKLLPSDFAQRNWSLIEDAISGVEGAVDKLRDKAGEEILLNIGVDKNWDDSISEAVQSLHQTIANYDQAEFKVGITLDPIAQANFYQACNDIIEKAGMTKEQAQAYFASMGYDVELEETTQTRETPWKVEYPRLNIRETRMAGVPIFEDETVTKEGINTTSVNAIAVKSITPNGSYGGGIGVNTTAPKSIAKKPEKSSGGGGGSRSKKEPKKAEDEIERYHKIDKTIDSLAKKYSRLSAAKDAAFGANRLKYIEQENKLLQQQYKAEKDRLKEIESYYSKDRAAIEAYGAIIDNNGVITNYDQIMQQELNRLNSKYAQYNAGGLSDEIIEAAEKDYEDFKKVLSQFEDTNSEYLDQLQKVEDAIRNQISSQIEGIKAKVELELELPDEQIKLIEFKLADLENRAFKSAEKIALWGDKAEKATQKFGSFLDGFKQLLSFGVKDEEGNLLGGFNLSDEQINKLMQGDMSVLEGLTGENAQAIIEALKEYEDNLIENYQVLVEARTSIEEELFNQLSEYTDAIDNQISKLEKLGSIASNIKTLMGTVGKEALGITADVLDQLNENILSASMGQIKVLKAEQQALQTSLDEAKEALAGAIARNDEEAIEYWTKANKEIENSLLDTTDTLISTVNTFAEQAAEIMTEKIKESFDNLAKNLYGMTLEDAQASYDRYKTLSDEYLKDYQKIYELSKLTRNIEKSINDTDNLNAKQKLRDLQKEINEYQAEGLKMTQYEVDYLNKKYELRQAEIALEEAKNSKDQVRLSRNTDGGWGYVYTANQDNIDKAQQTYEDKLYAMQQLNQQTIENAQSTILQLQKEFEDAVLEIYQNANLTEKEKQARIEELQQYYTARMQVYYNTLDTALANNRELYQKDWTEYSKLTDYRISADELYIDKFEETWLGKNGTGGIANGITTAKEAFELYQSKLGTYDEKGTVLGDTKAAIDEYKKQIEEALGESGLSGNIGGYMSTIKSGIDDATKAGKELSNELGEELPKTINDIDRFQKEFNSKIEAMATKIVDINTALSTLIDFLSRLDGASITVDIEASIPDSSDLMNRITNAVKQAVADGLSGLTITVTSTNTVTPVVTVTQGSRHVTGQNDPVYIYNDKNTIKLDTYATGGYTGNWGPNGRLAMLHEKELVLNEDDTANMLKMVGMVRDTVNNINLGSQLGSFRASIFDRHLLGMTNNTEQNITIEANFPNVVNHLEIEEAFHNLANYAAQNAYRFDLSQQVNIF